jgi:phosphate transport system permease protein
MRATATPATDSSATPRDDFGSGGRHLGDVVFQGGVSIAAGAIVLVAVLLLAVMVHRGADAFAEFGPSFVTTTTWNPVTHVFGVLPAIFGTLATSAVALVFALPIGVGAAIYLAEWAPRWLSKPLSFLIEMLAAIPSVIIGLWGLFIVVPIVRQVESAVGGTLGFLPVFSGPAFGIGLLSAGVLLAIMVLPILTAVSRDVLRAVPGTQREAMLALGATQWEMVWRVVLPAARSGVLGAVMLALGRAIGETLAVSMVIGNVYGISPSLFAPATTLASLIATQFREADTPLYLSALTAAGAVLFGITIVVNMVARVFIWRLTTHAVQAGGN